MKKTSGFTVIELMVVVAIIAITSAIAIPNLIAWRNNAQLNGSAREVQAFINEARLQAVKNNVTVTVTIDPAHRKIASRYVNRADVDLPAVEKENVLKPGITIDSGSTTFTGNTFSFNSRGFPTNFGTIGLKKQDGKTRKVIMSRTGDTRIG